MSSDYTRMLFLAKKTAVLEQGDIVLVKRDDGCFVFYRPSQWKGDVYRYLKFYPKTGYVKVIS